MRTAEDVRSLKDLLGSYECPALVIAKIEKPEALENLERIVEEADGVMVARGDLGVEIDVAETPVAQKRIIATCKRQHEAGDRSDANAGIHAPQFSTHAGRGLRRCQRCP